MKKQILDFEKVEGRSLQARRMYNARVQNLWGGKKLGQGIQKCVYDSNRHLTCLNKVLPPLPSNEVNVVLSAQAYDQEKDAKALILKALDPSMTDRIFITLHDEPTCTNMKLPKKCTSQARRPGRKVLVRSEKGSTNKIFETQKAFGYAVINLVFALWVLHNHDLVHGDVKIEPGANNAVRVGFVYKLIDLGWIMTKAHVKEGIMDRTSIAAQDLWNMRKYVYWSVGHLYAMFHLDDVKQACKAQGLEFNRVLDLYFENIDLMGLMRSLTVLVHLNPALKLKPLLKQLIAQPQDFPDGNELAARKIVWASANIIMKTIDVGERPPKYSQEMFLPLNTMYQRIRTYCDLIDLPDTIEGYASMPPK